MIRMNLIVSLGVAVIVGTGATAQVISIRGGPHDLSAGGPGPVRAASEDQICIFCHTPHNASPVGALWNRSLSPAAYSVYTSPSLDALPGQPTGTSKLCLSCHDGTIALGGVLSRDAPILMAGGVTRMPDGHANLGTNLSDDHPISFVYDSSLASRDPSLRDPNGLPQQIRLDSNRELQCSSCHDAHNNAFGQFLVMRNDTSDLCISCHQINQTDVAGHAQCIACHQSHTAPSGPFLLRQRTVDQTCLACHDGSIHGAADIASEMRKRSAHATSERAIAADGQPAAGCTGCHDPHTMQHDIATGRRLGQAPTPPARGRLGRIDGVNVSGAPVRIAGTESEVCYRCHADTSTLLPSVPRLRPTSNIRLQFNPSSASMHPVGAPGRAMQVPSLRPGWTVSSVIECSDCHGAEEGAPAGVHGSSNPMLLSDRYETADYTSESGSTYALCYRCHDRESILDNRSFPLHRLHVVDQRTSCAACHDGHGIPASQGNASANSHLINFQTDVVFADRVTGRLEFRDGGMFAGECYLSCHGVDHSPRRYPVAPGEVRIQR